VEPYREPCVSHGQFDVAGPFYQKIDGPQRFGSYGNFRFDPIQQSVAKIEPHPKPIARFEANLRAALVRQSDQQVAAFSGSGAVRGNR
jgi:hypothetical protein